MFAGDNMIKNPRIIIFIFVTLILMYIGIIGLILLNNHNDLISICLITITMFILAGCIYKSIYENKKDIEKNLKQ